MKKELIISAIVSLLLTACGNGKDGKNSHHTTMSIQPQNKEKNISIKVNSLAPLMNVKVLDKNNNTAIYDKSSNSYIFTKKITYPIRLEKTNSSYIDVNYNKKLDANDIKMKNQVLYSYFPYINLLTNYHYQLVQKLYSSYQSSKSNNNDTNSSINQDKNVSNNSTNDSNISKKIMMKIVTINDIEKNVTNIINNEFSINLDNPDNLNLYLVNFAIYNNIVKNNELNQTTIDNELYKIKDFFNNYLTNIIYQIKYYSYYDSLVLLNQKKIQRIDNIHKPEIPFYIKNNLKIEASNTKIDFNSIKIYKNKIYVSSYKDELISLNPNLSIIAKTNPDENSTAYNMDILNDKIYLADGKDGIKIYNLNLGIIKKLKIIQKTTYIEKNESNSTISIPVITEDNYLYTNVKAYKTPLNNKTFLSVIANNSLYLLDISNYFYDNSKKIIFNDGNNSKDMVFSDSGNNLFSTNKNFINNYDLTLLDKNYILDNKKFYEFNNSIIPYNIIINNNQNELFVSSNVGILNFDILNNGELQLNKIYPLEGSINGYKPQMYYIDNKNILIVSDGFKGIKIIKYNSNFNKPMLCGVEYFSTKDDNTTLAKVTSLDYDKNSNEIYIGIDSYGIIKTNLDNLIFRHCQ